MTVVVTGAAGFIGSALMARFAAEGVAARGVTRRPGQPGLVTVADYARLEAPCGATLVHLAEPSTIAAATARGEAHVEAVVQLCRRLLDQGWEHVVYASSSVVYGDAVAVPRHPAEPVAPADPYPRAKRACEEAVLAAGGTVLRLANVYGPGMTAGTVISHILDQIRDHGAERNPLPPLRLRDTMPVRDFLHVGDAAAGIARATRLRPGGVLNLGSGHGVAVGALARLLLDLAGQPERAVVACEAATRSSHLVLDASETLARLGWCADTPLATGLEMLLRQAP